MIIVPLIRIIMAIVRKHSAANGSQTLDAPASYASRTNSVYR